jgi:hypothetical protein
MNGFNSDDDRLLPCPFCGGSAEFNVIEGEDDAPNAGGLFIECLNPLCQASSALMFPNGEDPRPILLERWNKRCGQLGLELNIPLAVEMLRSLDSKFRPLDGFSHEEIAAAVVCAALQASEQIDQG